MQYIFDEAKWLSNVAKHGLDFVDVPLVFESVTFTFEDNRDNYNEQRLNLNSSVGRL